MRYQSQIRVLSLDVNGQLCAGPWQAVDRGYPQKWGAKAAGSIEQHRLLNQGVATEVRTVDVKKGVVV